MKGGATAELLLSYFHPNNSRIFQWEWNTPMTFNTATFLLLLLTKTEQMYEFWGNIKNKTFVENWIV